MAGKWEFKSGGQAIATAFTQQRLPSHRPTLPALVVSGSWHPWEMGEEFLPPNVYYLAKPFNPTQLAHALRLVLDGFADRSVTSGRAVCLSFVAVLSGGQLQVTFGW